MMLLLMMMMIIISSTVQNKSYMGSTFEKDIKELDLKNA